MVPFGIMSAMTWWTMPSHIWIVIFSIMWIIMSLTCVMPCLDLECMRHYHNYWPCTVSWSEIFRDYVSVHRHQSVFICALIHSVLSPTIFYKLFVFSCSYWCSLVCFTCNVWFTHFLWLFICSLASILSIFNASCILCIFCISCTPVFSYIFTKTLFLISSSFDSMLSHFHSMSYDLERFHITQILLCSKIASPNVFHLLDYSLSSHLCKLCCLKWIDHIIIT